MSSEMELRRKVLEANISLVEHGLVIFTWGNVSAIDREHGIIAIKPSGVSYDKLRVEDIVLTDLEGKVVEGDMRPSSDLPTHVVLYDRFKSIGSIVHTHSTFATAWAQAGRRIPCFGTTHADHFYGPIPCTVPMTDEEINGDYERATGIAMARLFAVRSPESIPGALVYAHGPFAWGHDASEAVYNATVLEEIAKMAYSTMLINPSVAPVSQTLLDRHYQRKHGENAYYGQKGVRREP